MSFIKGLSLLMTFSIIKTEVQLHRNPFGPLLCAELCKNYSQCKDATFIGEMLLCQILEDKMLGPCLHSIEHRCVHQRYLMGRRGILAKVDLRHRGRLSDNENDMMSMKPSTATGTTTTTTTGNFLMKNCNLHLEESIVLSASKSLTCPYIVYFLNLWKGKRALLSFNMLTRKSSIINCYKIDYSSKQLFVGACINHSWSCLYKLRVSTKLQIVSYKENCFNGVPLIIGNIVSIKHQYGCPAACFVGKTKVFHCLIRGELQTINPDMKRTLPLRYPATFDKQARVRDIAVDTNFSYVVLIHNKKVTLATLNYSNMTLSTVKVLNASIQTVTRDRTRFMFHDGEFDSLFAFCSVGDLVSGTCSAKMKSIHS